MKKVVLVVALLALVKWWYTDPTISIASNDLSFSYIVKYSGHGGSGDDLPMLVALHGNGDTTQNFYETALDQFTTPARIILLEGPFAKGSGSAWPWSAAEFSQYGSAINEAIELLAAKYPTRGKPVLLGFSGGAMMAYYQGAKHGRSYSAIFPISGKLSGDLLGAPSVQTGAKVFAFHGKSDSVISLSGGKSAVQLLREKGVSVKFVEFDSGHHGIFQDMKTTITQAVEVRLRALQ